ncbi:MAG: lytic transglycosylase domain-containing protein [Elusimicrobia bacterium]|nr:lytic transglycosylase domain-containing protein [Elusimicrobiota bacterium]
MSSTKRQSLLAWVVGVVLFSILCAHAVSPDPGTLRESVSRGPLLAQATLRPFPAIPSAAFGLGARLAPHSPGSSIAPPKDLKVTRRTPLVVPVPKPTPAYKYTFHVLSEHPEITDRYDELILENSLRHGMDPRLVKALIAAESEFSTEALSPHGAQGLMQVMPITAEELGVPRSALHDPQANIHVGTAYLERLYRAAWKQYRLKGVKYPDAPLWVVQRIIASYNAGPRALTRNSFMRQTRNYVRKVLLFYRSDVTEFRRSPKRAGAADGLPRHDLLP